MAILPIKIELNTLDWQEITSDAIPLELVDEENIEIYHNGAGLIEVIIDTLGTATIDSSFDGKGRTIEGSKFLTFPYLTTTRFYVRRIKYVSKPKSQIQIRKQIENINGKIQTTGAGAVQNLVFPFGEQLVGQKFDDVSIQFQYNFLDTQFDVRFLEDGAGANVGVNDSVAFAETLLPGENAWIRSIDSVRYRPGHSGFIVMTLGADVTNGGFVHGGGFDPDMSNGFIIEIDSNGLKFGYLKNGSFKGSNNSNTLDDVNTDGVVLENLNIYMIMFGYLGVSNPILFIKHKSKWRKLHEVNTEGVSTETHTSTPVFPIMIMSHNGAKAISGSWNGGVIGESAKGIRPFAFPNNFLIDGALPEQSEMTLTSTDVGTIVIFNSKLMFQGKTNNVKARLTGFRFSVDVPSGNVIGQVVFQLIGAKTLSGVATYTDINTDSSVIRYDHTNGVGASVDITDAISLVTEVVAYTGSNKGGNTGNISINAESIGAFAYAGDSFGIVAKDLNGNGVTVRAFLNWEELF